MAGTDSTRRGWRFQDLTGQTFNRLTVVDYAGKKGQATLWRCRCVCGGETVAAATNLKSGRTTSCGCRHRETIQRVPVETRLWPRIKKTDGCWEWQGALSKGGEGYGVISLGPGAGNAFVHRLVYELLVGPVPAGLCVLHRCDNPPCCRPDHLFLGTRTDNLADMRAKGREYKGPHAWAAKLTAEQVAAIWQEYRGGGIGHKRLAKKHGVLPGVVWDIVKGRSWRHVTGPLGGEACGPQPGEQGS